MTESVPPSTEPRMTVSEELCISYPIEDLAVRVATNSERYFQS